MALVPESIIVFCLGFKDYGIIIKIIRLLEQRNVAKNAQSISISKTFWH
jgi:hypothetical protein